ncbi:MAG: hypothetical protein AAF907_02800, partial [Planctomycetota bacterium]
MTSAPLLLVLLLPTTGELTGVALERRTAADLNAALERTIDGPIQFAAGTPLLSALASLLPGQTILPDTRALGMRNDVLGEARIERTFTLPAGRYSARTAVQATLD